MPRRRWRASRSIIRFPRDELLRALNARLKAGDIRIRSIEEMPDRWDARIFAKGKTYRYAIWNGAHAEPVPAPRRVARAAGARSDRDGIAPPTALVGEHDFVAFKGRGSDVMTTVRRVWSAELVEMNIHTDQPIALSPLDAAADAGGRLFRFEITGTGFLRHMVRTIAGTLVDIGRGNMAVDDMRAIIESKDRSRTGQTAPAQGLMLWKVRLLRARARRSAHVEDAATPAPAAARITISSRMPGRHVLQRELRQADTPSASCRDRSPSATPVCATSADSRIVPMRSATT